MTRRNSQVATMDSTDVYEIIFKFLCNKQRQKLQDLPLDVRKNIKDYKVMKCSGHLSYCDEGIWLKVLRNKEEQMHAIKQAHVDSVSGRHNSSNITVVKLKKKFKYYWNSMQEDVKNYISICSTCNLEIGADINRQSEIWKQVLVNILGPFTSEDENFKYLVFMMDPVSFWIEGTALSSDSDTEVVNYVFKTFTRMGFCQCNFLEMDKARCMKLSSKLNSLYAGLANFSRQQVSKKTSAQDCDPSVSKAEAEKNNFISSSKKIPCQIIESSDVQLVFGDAFFEMLTEWTSNLNKLIESNPSTWVEKLDMLLFQFRNASKHCKPSPFHKMFQRFSLFQEKDKQSDCEDASKNEDDLDDSGVESAGPSRVILPEKLEKFMAETLDMTPVTTPSETDHEPDSDKHSNISTDVNKSSYDLRKKLKLLERYDHLKRILQRSSNKRSLSVTSSGATGALTVLKRRKKNGSEPCGIKNSENFFSKSHESSDDSIEKDTTETKTFLNTKEIHLMIVADNNETSASGTTEINDLELSKKAALKRGRKLEKELPFKCPKCIATYLATDDELQFHLKCHVPDGSLLKCPNCPKSVRNWSHLTRHLVSHEDLAHLVRLIPEDRRTCSYCGKIFTSREGKLRHELVIHKGVSSFECNICKAQFKERKTYKRHMDLHADVVHQCEHCSYSTKVLRNFVEHSRIHQGRGYECPICKKVFTKQSVLVGHMEIHNSDRSSFICDQCGMKLANAGSLRQHVRNMHGKPGTYPCNQCSYVGKTKSNLTGHTDRCHNKPFKCSYCAYCTKSEKSLIRHMDIFHNESERRFPCPSCPYRARDPKHLTEHLRFRHNPNSSRFPCQYCSMKFKTMTMLRHHLPSHTGQHLYSCQLCGYSAKYRQTVHHHVKVKHPGESPSNVVKGTPCSEIPCEVRNEDVKEEERNDESSVLTLGEEVEHVVLSNKEENASNLLVANVLTGDSKPTNIILDASSLAQLAVDQNALAIADGSTIQFQIIEGDEKNKNVTMKIVPSKDQTNKAVELLLVEVNSSDEPLTEIVTEEAIVEEC